MKKTILSIAILASSILAFAGTKANGQDTQSAATEQAAPAKNNKGDKKAKGNKRGGKEANADRKSDRENMLFSGITLTDTQKASLDELNARNKEAREARKKDGKKGRESLSAEEREQQRADMAASRRAYLADVKQILTPEQYATFLENNFVYNDKGHKSHKGHRNHKADRKDHDRKSGASGNKTKDRSDKRRS